MRKRETVIKRERTIEGAINRGNGIRMERRIKRERHIEGEKNKIGRRRLKKGGNQELKKMRI